MKSTDHERWSDDLAAYLLGALEPGEVAKLDRHLAVCERCRAELRRLEPAARALPEEVERIEPPAELRSRILGEVRADARQAGVDPGSRENGFRRLAARLRGSGPGAIGRRPIAGLAALALVVVAVAVYASGGGSGGEGTGARMAYHAGHAPGVTAEVVRTGKGGTLRLANVRQLPDGRILEAWVRREGRIEPVRALFVPDREGRASTTIADMHKVDTVMVTAEPRGGTDYPTSTPIVTVPIPQ
jgi:anti-sigma-K factor RskA